MKFYETFKNLKLGEIDDDFTREYFEGRGWKHVLFSHVGDGHNDPKGQKMIWVTNKPYVKDGNNELVRKGSMYLSSTPCSVPQFYINNTPIFYRIRSVGVFDVRGYCTDLERNITIKMAESFLRQKQLKAAYDVLGDLYDYDDENINHEDFAERWMIMCVENGITPEDFDNECLAVSRLVNDLENAQCDCVGNCNC